MKKNIFYISLILMIFMSQLFFFPTKSKAGFWSDIITQSSSFIQKGKTAQRPNADGKIENINVIDAGDFNSPMAQIFNALIAIATVIAVIVGGILGIKFMMASAEDKAQIKEALIPYVLGCAVIFGAYGIWKLVVTVLAQI